MKTIKLQGKDYAEVVERLREFRNDCPRGKIETTPMIQEDGKIIFKTFIKKDIGESNSAESTGHALGENKGQKSFEKLETISVGRALALLGYCANGQIASGEEMEEYLEYKEEKKEELLTEILQNLNSVKNLEELKEVWSSLSAESKIQFEDIKNKIKKEFENKI